MNTDDARFDRLVDDELCEEERRELLGRLESEPGGWRRCAMAFLEAQCWQQSLGAATRNVHDALRETFQPNEAAGSAGLRPARKGAGETPALRRRSPWIGRLSTLSAMAASFLVAMWLGTVADRAWRGQPGAPVGIGGGNQFASTNPGIGDRPFVGSFQRENSNLAAMQDAAHVAPNPLRVVTVSAPSDGQNPRPSIDVPAVERDNVDGQWLRSLPPTIPDDVLQALARTGHQVEQQRELVPVPLNDGRRLVLPVDRVNVRYVGTGPY
jgi:hypothetical protein